MKEYFSHDFQSRDDKKIVQLRIKYGWEGYGLYWALVEMLHESVDHTLECERNALVMRTQCDEKYISEFVQYAIEIDLFTLVDDGKSFTSVSVLKRVNEREAKSLKARKSADSRWKVSDANAMRTHSSDECDRNAIKGKKRKEKESKVLEDCESLSATQNPSPQKEKLPPGFRPNTEVFESHVWLSAEEHHKLVQEFNGKNVAAKTIALSTGIENGLKKYTSFKNHYATLRNWLTNDAANGKLQMPKEDVFAKLKEKFAAEEALEHGN